MTLEQLNALMNWVTEIALYEAAEANNTSEDGWPIDNDGEKKARETMIEAFGFEVHHIFGYAQERGENEALFAEYERQRQIIKAGAQAEARKKKSAKRKAKS